MLVVLAAFHGILASSTLLPLLLAVALTLLIDGTIVCTVWRCVRGQRRPLGRSPRAASRAAREAVLHRFADAVARGDFAEAEAEATRFFRRR